MQRGTEDFAALLRESAPMSRSLADRHCLTPLYGDAACQWYHGTWQYFSALGAVATPWRQAAFYGTALASAQRGADEIRVLVAGSADYAMLAVAHHALGARAGYTIVDVCETPLALNRWFAARAGISIETWKADVRTFAADEAFDVVCTHAFLGNFPPHERASLVGAFHRLLRPGGRLVSVNRVRPSAPAVSRFDKAQARTFRACVADAARRTPLAGVDARTLDAWADAYTRHYRSYPLDSWTTLESLFADGGFVVERLEFETQVPGGDGPSTGGGGRACFVVRRR